MSTESERLIKKLSQQLMAEGVESEEDINALLERLSDYTDSDSFMAADEIDKAYDEYAIGCELLDSDDPEEERQAVRHLKKAIKLHPPFFDARLRLLELEPDTSKFIEKLKALEAEAEQVCLEDSGLTRHDVFGDAWGIIEMRPFLRIKHRLAIEYMDLGMRRLAIEKLEDILQWNEGDNQGCRFILIGLYAFFEELGTALELYSKYGQEQAAWNLLSLACLYYKRNDEKTSLAYIKKLAKAIPDAYQAIYSIITDADTDSAVDREDIPYYHPGSEGELLLALQDLGPLMASSPSFLMYMTNYAIEQYEKQLAKAKPKQTAAKQPSGKQAGTKQSAGKKQP
jgi:tetratricopeptide (TPR) repeat protein